MDRLDDLRAKWHAASEKGKHLDAVKALVELERLVPDDPLWSQRLGEAYRRAGRERDAVDAFVRAFERFYARGFLPRAIAMAKLVTSLDAARGDLLERQLRRESDSALDDVLSEPVPTPKGPRGRGLPEPREPPPFDASRSSSARLVVPATPAVLERAEDSTVDEVRFSDATASGITMSLEDVGGAEASVDIEVRLDDDDESPPTRPLGAQERAQKYDAYGAMAAFRLFASLTPSALLSLANAAELVEFKPGAVIIVRDERAFALYAIVSGAAIVTVPVGPGVRLREGDVFGEGSLLDDGTRQASVKAETALMALRIEKRALDEVTKEHPEVEAALFDLLARRLVANLMTSSQLFAPFEPPVRLELAKAFEIRRAPSGTVLAENGRRSDGLYILLAGTVMAAAPGQAPTRIARGAMFGHASLLRAGTADLTIRAVSESVVLRLPASRFTEVAAHYPPVLAHLAETASDPPPMSERVPRT